jgi:hypothetical protein
MHRVERRKLDVIHCVTSTSPANAGYCCGLIGKPKSDEGYRIRAMKWLGLQYTKKRIKAVVITLWLGLLAAGLHLSTSALYRASFSFPFDIALL